MLYMYLRERLHEFSSNMIPPYGIMDRRGPWIPSEIPSVQTGLMGQGTRYIVSWLMRYNITCDSQVI